MGSPLLACDELLCPQKARLVCVTHPLLQIHIDIPRTNPLIPLFQQPLVQEVRGRRLGCVLSYPYCCRKACQRMICSLS